MSPSDVASLVRRGVVVPAPGQVFLDGDVDPERIQSGAVLHPGTRLHGARTFVAAGCELGPEGPVVARDSIFGERSRVASGYVEGAVLLRDAQLGANAYVRPGTLLEEEASTGHAVGLKQTLLLSFVTLGSLINFCDVLMAGGTSRRDHSEVGSGFIHFNFTPWGKSGDKATPSLVGDVPRGVFLDQARIFLGGMSGMVGPRRVGFGSLAGAGQVLRQHVGDGRMVVDVPRALDRELRSPLRQRVGPVLELNAAFLGQLAALRAWYEGVRLARVPEGTQGTQGTQHLALRVALAGAIETLDACTAERRKRLGAFLEENQGPDLADEPEVDAPCPWSLGDPGAGGSDHVEWVQALSPEDVRVGVAWLTGIAESVSAAYVGR